MLITTTRPYKGSFFIPFYHLSGNKKLKKELGGY
ncbi:Hypothetical Protein SLY_1102 [Strawberry lethal yellows phytoplasma (CPA) str. NZSb11]|uniref:Uncharacterized protein n=1 Tax=Strawberry lethal yellows phytoplasma (CPA) str. NZSb11 TaxID=980422 RepID=R4S2I8_PHYAS|nr:Hypothetical Protein SLY_1102 [Strawberry lethal yellows phytoplasma (CPA) str. NZSb11]